MQSQKQSQLRGSLFIHRPSSNLFEEPNKGDTGPQEIDSASPSAIEERPDTAAESPEAARRSSLAGETTPATVGGKALEDNFMLDSLNDQRNSLRSSKPRDVHKPVVFDIEKGNDKSQTDSPDDSVFMNALQVAIAHFENESSGKTHKEVKKLNLSHAGEHKQSPTSSHNGSNTTTANSTGEDAIAEQEQLKREYNALLAKYNELKTSNKSLMNDYAVLRSQFEEMKAMKAVYEKEIQQLRQQVCDAEMRLTRTTELYTREKIEKEGNAVAFKRILETISCGNGMQKTPPPASMAGSMCTPHAEMDDFQRADAIADADDSGSVTFEYVQKLEHELAQKDREIQLIKAKLKCDKAPKECKMGILACSPNANLTYMGGGKRKGSPQTNVVRDSIQNPGLAKGSLFSKSPTEASRTMIKAVPGCSSAKGNIQIPGKAGTSPKAGQAFHKFRSPSYTEQDTALLKIKPHTGNANKRPPARLPPSKKQL